MNTQLHRCFRGLAFIAFTFLFFTSCKKNIDKTATGTEEFSPSASKDNGHLKQTKTHPSDVVQKWITFDLRLVRTNASLNNYIMMQHWAYSGIALYESVVPGMPSYQTLSGQLNQMPAMPETLPGHAYHWPTAANSALAAMVRNFYPSITAADKISTDSLEQAINSSNQNAVTAETFQRSIDFGKAVALIVYNWSKTDGSLTVHPIYSIPVGAGLWQPTPSGFLAPQNPYWGTNRTLVPGAVAASQIAPPTAYSADPTSNFYAMVKEVYDASLVLTIDQKAQATFWRDIPGGGTHAHWLAILGQVLNNEGSSAMLDKAALVYAKMGITQSDSRISCWSSKYGYNVLRPITYIRSVLGHPVWNAFLTTPNHPEYPSAHSTFSAAAAAVLSSEFGHNYQYTDHTYDYLGLPARSYNSFIDAVNEAGMSRFYAGIHYLPTLAAGNSKGASIVNHMNATINFKK